MRRALRLRLGRHGNQGLSPTDDRADTNFDDPKGIEYSHNIVVHPLAKATQESGVVGIGTYASDALFDKTVPALTFESNCDFNPSGPLSFALFAANGGSYGSKGAEYPPHSP